MKTIISACPRNCYSTCSLKVGLDEKTNVIRRVETLPSNQATSSGTCLKGISYVERQYSQDRLKAPLLKDPETGEFHSVSWEDAYQILFDKMDSIRRQWGPQAVFYYSGSGTKGLLNSVGKTFWEFFGGYTTSYGDLCWPAGLEATRLTLGAIKHNVPWDIEHADLVILWGKNPAETNIQQMESLDKARSRRARVIVVDPRRTQTADRADMLVQVRPGSDGALALGICAELVERNWVNSEFIQAYVKGYEPFKNLLKGWNIEKASALTGVSTDLIETMVQWIGESRAMTICPGFGMQRFSNGGQTMRAMLSILALTGQIGKKGAGWMYANLQSDLFSTVGDPLALYPPEKPDGIVRCSIATARWGQDVLEQKDPPIKMVWIERGNPVAQNPHTGKTIEALKQMEFRVVVDQFLTDTALEADLVLPAKTLFEQSDLIGAYWHSYVQFKPKIVEPPPGVKTELEIYRSLAEKFQFPEAFFKLVPVHDDADIRQYLTEKLKPFPQLTLEALSQGPVLAPGTQTIAFQDMVFPTPSGKIELDSSEASDRWGVSSLPDFIEPGSGDEVPSVSNDVFYLLTPNSRAHIHSQFHNLNLVKATQEKAGATISPGDAMKLQIKPGQKIRIFNDRGSLVLPVKLDAGMHRRCVSIPNGLWVQLGGGVNVLSRALETDMGHGAAFHDTCVKIEKVVE